MDNSADRQLGYLVLICMTALPGDKSQNIVHILIPGVRGLFYLSSSRMTGIFKVHQYCSTAFYRATWQIFVQISIPGGYKIGIIALSSPP